MAVRLSPPPPLPLRFNMRQTDCGRFTAITEALLAEIPEDLPLAMRASLFTDSIMEAASQAIPLAKPHTRLYRDAWIYGPQVKELNRRVNAARKAYRRAPSPSSRAYLHSVVHHARAVKNGLREQAWLDWCCSLGSRTTVGAMWQRVKAMYAPSPRTLPTHPSPDAETDRLARIIASRSSPVYLPLPVRHLQASAEEGRSATIDAACRLEAPSDAPFTSEELRSALYGRRDTVPGLDLQKEHHYLPHHLSGPFSVPLWLCHLLDLEKALELAQPLAILEVLADKDVAGRLLHWVCGFLHGRTASVRFQGCLSESLSHAHSHSLGTP
ncbi:hypothetical protein E2C01_033981 [Portunus trituberculatus]|uniref:Uncharacterized protein n=1 Tax=Portunus trituberculatus TaxID=210409 RepID=A0A5B7F5P1_PORTR|nr:hypothetical protein [Portunus trituberculatus]